MFLYGISCINKQGYFEIGGVDMVELVLNFGIFFYVYDVVLIWQCVRGFKEIFEKYGVKVQVVYVSKVFFIIVMV